MLAGVSGQLISTAFLDRDLQPIADAEEVACRHRQFAAIRQRASGLGPSSTPRSIFEAAAAPLVELLGFDTPSAVDVRDEGVASTLCSVGQPVALIVTTWASVGDSSWRAAVSEAARRGAAWCFAFDGRRLRIVDGQRVYARRCLEFDVDLAADDRRTFAALWRTCHARAAAARADEPESLRALVAASDRYSAVVCRSLRHGVLTAATEILRAISARSDRKPRTPVHSASRGSAPPPLDSAFEQALTIVYRMLFLLFAEARALVPLWHPIYRDSYSIESLRVEAEQRPTSPGLWDALRAIARLAHSGCLAGDLQVNPFNGRLFAPSRTPLAERRDLDDEPARRAVIALTSRPTSDRRGRERVAYRDLGVEQLGAVYETLLDYEPAFDNGAATLRAGSGVRKATATFYTPQPIADYLARRTLRPLVAGRRAESILELRIVDPAMGSGAFLVAACRYLAAEYEVALIRDGHCLASDIDERERAAIRRTVAERCLYGVDLNPMAVQLARLSLWLATLAADRPLSFLDHRLQVGDSVLGTWLGHLRRPPSRRGAREDRALPLFDDDDVATALRAALPHRFSLESTPNDTIDQVRRKEQTFAMLGARDAALSRWKMVAHLWCAPWFAGDAAPPASAYGALTDAALGKRSELPAKTSRAFLDAATAAATERRLFHWELEFPEAFFEADGQRRARPGFDAVIGNPPWDMLRGDAGAPDARARERALASAVIRFTREAGVYAAQSDGHANRYQVFVERAIALTRRGGRFGLVLPSGFAIDQGSAALRRLLLSRCDVDAIVGMDNHRGVFPIHRSVRFLLLTATAGGDTGRVACRLGVDDPASLESLDDSFDAPGFPVQLSPPLLERLSGPGLAIPHLRSSTDVVVAERAATLFPPLGAGDWQARFGRELNATDDGAVLRDDRHGLLVVDGRHLQPFRVSLEEVRRSISAPDARRLLKSAGYERSRLAYRDVASATNRVTLIAAVLPRGVVSTHTVFCLRTPRKSADQHFLCGLFNSLVVNYLVRLRVSTHVTTGIVEHLPIPAADDAPAAYMSIAAAARLLARRHDTGVWARLNADVARLYELSAGEFDHVLATFPLVQERERSAAAAAFTGRG